MRSRLLLLLLGISLQFAGTVSAVTIGNNDVGALKNALNSSNSNGTDDIIDLATNGTYTLTTADNTTNGPTGLPVITGDSGHTVTIHGHGSTISRSGSNALRIFAIASDANVIIDSLTISNGSASPSPGAGVAAGGAIYSNGGTLTLTSCNLNSNVAKGANGADGVSAEPNANDGDGSAGGAVSSSGTLTATSCSFANNSAQGGNGGNGFGLHGIGGDGANGLGGAVAAGGGSAITACVFTGNAAGFGSAGSGGGGSGTPGSPFGGAVYISGMNVSVTHCTFDSNTAYGTSAGFAQYPGEGGGIYGVVLNAPSVLECSFTNNHADYAGAAIGALLSGCSFSGNGANVGGGAIASLGGGFPLFGLSTTAINCTFYNNIAQYGGAVYSDGASNRNTVTNCTLVHNTATVVGGSVYLNAIVANCIFKNGAPTNFSGGSISSQGHNLSDDAAEGDGATGPGGDLNATGDMRNTSPQLLTSTPQNNGGATQTFALLLNSPAINHGDDSKAPKRDQRGNFRTGVSDIGAYEDQGGLVGKSSISKSGSDVLVSPEVCYGHTYRLERKLNLTDANWNEINGVNEFIATGNDTEPVKAPGDFGLGKAFYHVICVQ